MRTLICTLVAIVCCIVCLCSCGKAQEIVKQTWVARENNGDKPGVEYRLWFGADGQMTGEMWLFVVDENGKDKERGKYPITITASDKSSIKFNYKSGDGSVDEIAIHFTSRPNNAKEKAVLENVISKEQSELLFHRINSGE